MFCELAGALGFIDINLPVDQWRGAVLRSP